MKTVILSISESGSYLRSRDAYQVANILRSEMYTVQVVDFINYYNEKELKSIFDSVLSKKPDTIFMSDLVYEFIVEKCAWILDFFKNKKIPLAVYSAVETKKYTVDLVCYGKSSVLRCVKRAPDEKVFFTNSSLVVKRFRFYDDDYIFDKEVLKLSFEHRDIDDVIREVIENQEKWNVNRYIIDDNVFNTSDEKLILFKKYLQKTGISLRISATVCLDNLKENTSQLEILNSLGVDSVTFDLAGCQDPEFVLLVANNILLNYPHWYITCKIDLHTRSDERLIKIYEILRARKLVNSVIVDSTLAGSEFYIADSIKWSGPAGDEIYNLSSFGIDGDELFSPHTRKIDEQKFIYLARNQLENYRTLLIQEK